MAVESTTRLESINEKLAAIESVEEKLEQLVAREEKDIKALTKEEQRVDRHILKIGEFTIKRSHALELFKGVAGAFLGVGIGPAFGATVTFAKNLPLPNVFGILLFIFFLVSVLIYRNDKDKIPANKNIYQYILKKIVILYSVSLIVEYLSLLLFNNYPGWNVNLVKVLIVGSYATMSAAAAFTLI